MNYSIRSAEYRLKAKAKKSGYIPIVIYISREDLVNKKMVEQKKAKKVTDDQMMEVADTMEILCQMKDFWNALEGSINSILKR